MSVSTQMVGGGVADCGTGGAKTCVDGVLAGQVVCAGSGDALVR